MPEPGALAFLATVKQFVFDGNVISSSFGVIKSQGTRNTRLDLLFGLFGLKNLLAVVLPDRARGARRGPDDNGVFVIVVKHLENSLITE